jgi:Protein of unknown function (DUF664)
MTDYPITEPSFTADETEMLLFAIERSRAQFAWKTGDLDAAALNRAFPPSAMTLGGLVKHLAWVEDVRTAMWVTGEAVGTPWAGVDEDWPWRSAADDSPEELYGLWHAAVDRADAALAKILADAGPEQPSKYVISTGEAPNLRRSLVDLHDEYARHVGQADLLREAIDGLVGEDPPQR